MSNFLTRTLIAAALASSAVYAAQAQSKPLKDSKASEKSEKASPINGLKGLKTKPVEKFQSRKGYKSEPMPMPSVKEAPKFPRQLKPEDLKAPTVSELNIPTVVSTEVDLQPLVKGERELRINLPDYTGTRLREENLQARLIVSKRPIQLSGGSVPSDTMILSTKNTRQRSQTARLQATLPQFNEEEMEAFNNYRSGGVRGGRRTRVYAKAGLIGDTALSFVGGETVHYRVALEPKDGGQTAYSAPQSFVMPHPIVLAVIGDSFGAGEGAPEKKSTNHVTAKWSVQLAHNSYLSGGSRAIHEFKQNNKKLWVVSHNFAITGATIHRQTDDIAGGILGDYKKSRNLTVRTPRIEADMQRVSVLDANFDVPRFSRTESQLGSQNKDVRFTGQIEKAEEWLVDNQYDRIDLLFLSAGGNDAGFGGIIKDSISGLLGVTDFFDLTELEVERRLDETEAHIPNLRTSLQQRLNPAQVYWFNYPNLTRDQDGVHSDLIFQASENVLLEIIQGSVSARDLAIAERILKRQINPRVAKWCGTFSNCTVLDIQDRADGHGIGTRRAEDRWFNTFVDSHDIVQGSLDGAIHPNAAGHNNIYKPAALEVLNEIFSAQTGSHFEDVRQARQASKDQRRLRELFSQIEPVMVTKDLRQVARLKQQRDQRTAEAQRTLVPRQRRVAADPVTVTKEQKAQLLVLYADDPEALAEVENLEIK